MRTCYNSKCLNILYTANITRPKFFKSFCEYNVLRILGHFDTENYM